MKLFTKEFCNTLLTNGRKQDPVRGTPQEIDFFPVLKLFTPDAACTWLLTEIEAENPAIAFGLCDLGMQCPELGSVYLPELESLRGKLGLPIERDLYFKAAHPLTVYPIPRSSAAWPCSIFPKTCKPHWPRKRFPSLRPRRLRSELMKSKTIFCRT